MLASVGFHRSGCGLVGPLCVFCDVCSFWHLHIVALVSMDLASEPVLILLQCVAMVGAGFPEFIVSVTGDSLDCHTWLSSIPLLSLRLSVAFCVSCAGGVGVP